MRKHGDLLLDILNFVFSILKINDLDGNLLFGPLIYPSEGQNNVRPIELSLPFEHLAKRTLANTLALLVKLLGVSALALLKKSQRMRGRRRRSLKEITNHRRIVGSAIKRENGALIARRSLPIQC